MCKNYVIDQLMLLYLSADQRCSFHCNGQCKLGHMTKSQKGILVLWLLVGYWWDEVQNRWDPSHFMPSQTPTNHPSQFFWHCHNSVPKWKVSNKIIFERIIESKSFILNRNLAFICQLFGNWQGESVKKRIFYGQADRKGGGGQPSRPWL